MRPRLHRLHIDLRDAVDVGLHFIRLQKNTRTVHDVKTNGERRARCPVGQDKLGLKRDRRLSICPDSFGGKSNKRGPCQIDGGGKPRIERTRVKRTRIRRTCIESARICSARIGSARIGSTRIARPCIGSARIGRPRVDAGATVIVGVNPPGVLGAARWTRVAIDGRGWTPHQHEAANGEQGPHETLMHSIPRGQRYQVSTVAQARLALVQSEATRSRPPADTSACDQNPQCQPLGCAQKQLGCAKHQPLGDEMGMGMEFLDLDDSCKRKIATFVRAEA